MTSENPTPLYDRVITQVKMPPLEPLSSNLVFRDEESSSQTAPSTFLDPAVLHENPGNVQPRIITSPLASSSCEPAMASRGQRSPKLGPLLPPSSSSISSSPGDDKKIKMPNPERIREHFTAGGKLSIADAKKIITRAMPIFRKEANVLVLSGATTICGDTHGQYFDLLTIFSLGGDPATTQYLFLGDYVDRGNFSTEIVLLLFSYKIMYPTQMFLLRGNHECRHLTTYFNFREECIHKYDLSVYDQFIAAFECLPLAALVDGMYLCVHGGLSPHLRTIEDIALIDRFVEPPQRGAMCDLLWADPMEDEEERLCQNALFLHNETRGCSYVFSHKATLDFLADNDVATIVRAHEAQEEGYRLYRKVPETGMPATFCVFSAPNYCEYDNKAAILLVNGKQLQIKQFHSAEQPYVLPNFMHAFSWSMPFVCDKLRLIVQTLLAEGTEIELQSPANFARRRILARAPIMRLKARAVMRMLWLLKRVKKFTSPVVSSPQDTKQS